MKKRLPLILILCCIVLLAGCEKKVTTVKDDITKEEGTANQYITVDTFEVKDVTKEDLQQIGYCAILIPENFQKSDSVEGMYISNLYPLDSSNIYYSILESDEEGYVKENLTSAEYENSVENGFKALGDNIDLIVDAFECTDVQGAFGYEVRSHYSIGERDVQQLVYIIPAQKTHVITYSQTSDDELMYDFMVDEGQIRLVKNISDTGK